MKIVQCNLTNNRAKTNGGAIGNWQGDMTIDNCIFNNNKANSTDGGAGGAMYNYEGTFNITKSVLINNPLGILLLEITASSFVSIISSFVTNFNDISPPPRGMAVDSVEEAPIFGSGTAAR